MLAIKKLLFLKQWIFKDGDYWKRLKKAYVTVSESEDTIFYIPEQENLYGYYEDEFNQNYTTINCDKPVSGQFVQILFDVTDRIAFHEIEVNGV